MKYNSKKTEANEISDGLSFSKEEKAFLELIAKIIVRISFEEAYRESKKSNNEKELE